MRKRCKWTYHGNNTPRPKEGTLLSVFPTEETFAIFLKSVSSEYCEDIDSNNNIINEDDLCQKNQFWVAIYYLKIIELF